MTKFPELLSDYTLIKNGKYLVEPWDSDLGFKQLFLNLASKGAGRPVDKDGVPDGPWTPALLTEAICALDSRRDGIDIRTVQHWFHNDGRGVNYQSLRCLARIFGCDDPEYVSEWQKALSKATKLHREKRQLSQGIEERRDSETDAHSIPSDGGKEEKFEHPDASSSRTSSSRDPGTGALPRRFSVQVENTLSGQGSINLIIGHWLVFCCLGILNYAVGTLSVTYEAVEGVSKQVGFLWAPTLTVLPLIVLPLYVFFVADLITYWRSIGRYNCFSDDVNSASGSLNESWYAKVNEFSFSFAAIAWFCFLFVACSQWLIIYLPAYISGDTLGVQIDRYLVTLVRPDVISVPEAVFLSIVGYLYTASYISVFMFGLLLLLIVALDFYSICRTLALEGENVDRRVMLREGQKIVWGGFRITVLALWIAILLKLQVTYLSSSSGNFLQWIITDLLTALRLLTAGNGWLASTTIVHFTTFLMVVVTACVFGFVVMRVKRGLHQIAVYGSDFSVERDTKEAVRMMLILGLLSANILLVGNVVGFSIFLTLGFAATMRVFSGPKLQIF